LQQQTAAAVAAVAVAAVDRGCNCSSNMARSPAVRFPFG